MKGILHIFHLFVLLMPMASLTTTNRSLKVIGNEEALINNIPDLSAEWKIEKSELAKQAQNFNGAAKVEFEKVADISSTEREYIAASVSTIATTTTQVLLLPDCPYEVEFLPATQCDQYYQCYASKAYLHTCPPGLYWNPEQSVCDWSDALCQHDDSVGPVAVDGSSCARGAIFLPDASNCRQFIQCVYGREVVRYCPGGLYWQQELMRCDYSNEACN